jgi:hypothetical protein
VSSPGFGAWRELASHVQATSWVLSGESPSFPLLYHWRVMPRAASRSLTLDETRDVERQVAAWGSRALGERLAARYSAATSITLFLECFPGDLRTWLAERMAADEATARAALTMVERELLAVTSFMNDRGMLHFDAHFANILTDGLRLYVSDFGQAQSSQFALTPAEVEFHRRHRDFDRSYVVAILARSVQGAPVGAAIRNRYGPIADLMADFFRKLRTVSRATPYPAGDLARLWAALE